MSSHGAIKVLNGKKNIGTMYLIGGASMDNVIDNLIGDRGILSIIQNNIDLYYKDKDILNVYNSLIQDREIKDLFEEYNISTHIEYYKKYGVIEDSSVNSIRDLMEENIYLEGRHLPIIGIGNKKEPGYYTSDNYSLQIQEYGDKLQVSLDIFKGGDIGNTWKRKRGCCYGCLLNKDGTKEYEFKAMEVTHIKYKEGFKNGKYNHGADYYYFDGNQIENKQELENKLEKQGLSLDSKEIGITLINDNGTKECKFPLFQGLPGLPKISKHIDGPRLRI